MEKFLYKNLKYFIAISISLFLLGGQPVEFGKDKTFFQGYLIPKPIIRIGLGVNIDQIKISASSGMKVYEVINNYKLIAEDIDEVFIKGFKEKLKVKYTIQVAHAKNKKEAEIIAQDLKLKIEQKVYVRQTAEDGFFGRFKIIVGDFINREDALNYIGKLSEHGIEDAWILREEITNEEPKPLWIMVDDEFKSLSDNTELYFIPSNPQSYLSYKGRDYRGILTLKAYSRGIVLVNTLYIEDYLKAVVPSELSPYDFPELEAQKAQAIAARTYAIRNMDSYDDLGFDLCDTPKSQYYLGMNAEHPISNQAVRETKGEAAVYKGKLINALYTSTCGGRTEDVENIFSGPALPYLRSTSCVYEKQREWQIKSNKSFVPLYVRGENISLEVASLISLGVIPSKMRPDFFNKSISVLEAESWLRKASALLGKRNNVNKNVSKKSSFSLEMFVDMVIDMFAWQGRVDNLLLESDKDFILKNREEWSEKTEGNAAYLIQSGILPSFDQVGSSHRVLTRGEVILYLWKVMQSYKSFTKEGIFKVKHEDKIELGMEEDTLQLVLSSDIFLIRNYNGIYSFVSQLEVLGGEKVKWIENEGKVLLIEIIYPPYSNILDRSSTYHNWQERISREDLSKKINQYYPVGELEDIVPQKRGSSKRVIELLIKGSNPSVLVKGLRIRRVLGLRDTLFIIDREFDEAGKVKYFTFRGKGWGHGVGLCQIGAFGMAQAGADYKEILKKYYHGIKIDNIY